ncbi:MAG: hypothetical protein P9X22_02980 [Candidatus Zapsychrus exili]|nr:hypothetical protein [Candidatus Zapsychrus exili]
MKKRINCFAIVALFIFIYGCAINSGVVSMGQDIYMVSRQAATGFSGSGKLKARALQEADKFCEKQGRFLEVIRVSEASPPYILANFPKAEVSFKCSEAVLPEGDQGLVKSGIEVTDILTVARKMAISILEIPEIMNAKEAPRVALAPVENIGNFNINENIFTKKIRIELNKNASKRISFIVRDFLNKSQITEYIMKERLIKREEKSNDEVGVTNITSSNDLDLFGVDFFLTGELNGLVKKNIRGQSNYVLMSFQLIDAETGVIVWEDAYEIKRVGIAGVAYQ